MISFDDVIETTVRVVQAHPVFARAKTACLVRDLRGRVRLALRPDGGFPSSEVDELETQLSDELGGYFCPPILRTDGPREHARLAATLLDRSEEWPAVWPGSYREPISGVDKEIDTERWRSFQRALSKEAWLTHQTAKPPWPLHPRTPTIAAFYSFKGGIGRTTLLGIMVQHLVLENRRVAVVDLDLEAPGIGGLLEAESARGVLDWIVDHCAAGHHDIGGYHAPANALGEHAGRVHVFPAGSLSWAYLEKLARLDFVAASEEDDDSQSPVARALHTLLKKIKSELEPDCIFIDSRSGLHDLGGLSLHGLAHIDVLACRHNPPNHQGLELTLEALQRRKKPSDTNLIVVHAMAPPTGDPAESTERQAFADRVYDTFCRTMYVDQDDVPAPDDSTAQHYPIVIPRYDALERIQSLANADRAVVLGDAFSSLRRRIAELDADEQDDGVEGEGAP